MGTANPARIHTNSSQGTSSQVAAEYRGTELGPIGWAPVMFQSSPLPLVPAYADIDNRSGREIAVYALMASFTAFFAAFLTISVMLFFTDPSSSTSSPASETTFCTALFTVAEIGCNSLIRTFIVCSASTFCGEAFVSISLPILASPEEAQSDSNVSM